MGLKTTSKKVSESDLAAIKKALDEAGPFGVLGAVSDLCLHRSELACDVETARGWKLAAAEAGAAANAVLRKVAT